MKKLFGTDGIRGKVNTYPITPETFLHLGKAVASYYKSQHLDTRPLIVIGKDTRLSGYMLENALTSGILSMGMNILAVGPLPTPAIARLIKSYNGTCGIMITASHNNYINNGIKLFGPNGYKLSDNAELQIEKIVFDKTINKPHTNTAQIGKAYRIDDAKGRYIEFAKSSIKSQSLKGLKIVLDCANGAGYSVAPMIFKELGADIIKTSCEPDGFNINKNCGSMYPHNISNLIQLHRADVGICLDGDADRLVILDSKGAVISGDRVLAMCAMDYRDRGKLAKNTLITTVMSNIGLTKAMTEKGINVETTDVGDHFVIRRMREGGFNLGGEQCGHIIFMDYVTTGDGIISALHILSMIKRKQKNISELANCIEEYPQILKNISIEKKIPINEIPELQKTIKKCERIMGEDGRVLVRYSGTENVLRIMVEAKKHAMAKDNIEKIVKTANQIL